jgi:hypothetical protein
MIRKAASATLLALTTVAFPATSARAVPPVHDTLEIHNVVQDNGEACGFPVRWEIDLVAQRTRFFNDQGQLVRVHLQISEDNTITNLDTGFTLREGPDRFIQRNIFEADGTVTIETNGLSVNVKAETGVVKDVGRFVVNFGPEGPVVLQSAGKHRPRELAIEGGFPAALAAFCDVLS